MSFDLLNKSTSHQQDEQGHFGASMTADIPAMRYDPRMKGHIERLNRELKSVFSRETLRPSLPPLHAKPDSVACDSGREINWNGDIAHLPVELAGSKTDCRKGAAQ